MANRRTFLSIVVLCAVACSRPKPQQPQQDTVRIRAFSDTGAIISMAALGPDVFVAKPDGLYRASWEEGTLYRVGEPGAITGVRGIAADAERELLWILTERGLTRFAPATGAFSDLPDPPANVRDSMERLVLAADGQGGLFVGGAFGLLRLSEGSEWKPVGISDPVTALASDVEGALWVGTEIGLRVVRDGVVVAVAAGDGVDLASVSALAVGTTGVIALGTTAAGKQRLVMQLDGVLRTFKLKGDEKLVSVVASKSLSVLVGENRLFTLRPATVTNPGRAPVVDFEPAPPPGTGIGLPAPVEAVLLGGRMPPRMVSFGVHGRRLLVGTREAGAASWVDGQWQWARSSDIAKDAVLLSVACVARTDCFIGSGVASWRWNGRDFRATTLKNVLAFVRHPEGGVFALTRAGPALGMAELKNGTWVPVMGLKIGLRAGPVVPSYARFSPGGLLWVGLSYEDEQGDLRPKGVALVDVELGAVSYHHASFDEKAIKRGILPVPISTTDVSFLGTDEVWLASSQGAVKLVGTAVTVFGEAEGLASEVLRGIACSSSGVVFVGTRRGVGVFQGEGWNFPQELAMPVNDLSFGLAGTLWLATTRGLVSYAGAEPRVFDRSSGLFEQSVIELDVDHFGRVWLRGPKSLAVVAP